MKLTIDRDALAKALTRMSRVVERRTTIPILAHVALFADENGLRFKATDLDIEATDTLPADVEQHGSTTVLAHLFSDIVKKLPAGSRITLALADEGRMTLQSGRSRFTLQTLPIDEFPDLAAGDFSHSFDVPRAHLKRMLDKVEFAISTEETRYYLNGIYLHAATVTRENGNGAFCLRGVATDGHRLAQFDAPLPEGAEDMPGVIIPRKTVAEIGKLLDDGEGDIHVELSSQKIRLTFGTVVLTSKMIDGTFPDYQRVIPLHNDKLLTVDRESFAAAIERVATVGVERSRGVKVTLADGLATLSMSHPDTGYATEETEVEFDADRIEIGFNNNYLTGILGKIDGEKALIDLADSGSPTIFRSSGGADTLFVLMPMRV